MILDVLGVLCGLVLVYRAGEHIEKMSARSNHLVRAAYYELVVGGAALVAAPFAHDVDWMKPLGLFLVVSGAAILFAFDRRRSEDREKRVAG